MMNSGKPKWGRAWERVVADKRGHSRQFTESRWAEAPWQKEQAKARRWAVSGAILGALMALILFAPARWLTQWVNQSSGQRLLMAQAEGTVWNGSAQLLLTGGAGSKDASALPGRIKWNLGLRGLRTAVLRLEHACCIQGSLALEFEMAWGRTQVRVLPSTGAALGQWPNAWLSGLGTPWNTLELKGQTRLFTQDLVLTQTKGSWVMGGNLSAEMTGVSSRLSPLPVLGNYRFNLQGEPSGKPLAHLQVQTIDGPLQLTGSGTLSMRGLNFTGNALAATQADQVALSNLLNIIGRRDGAASIISIGRP